MFDNLIQEENGAVKEEATDAYLPKTYDEARDAISQLVEDKVLEISKDAGFSANKMTMRFSDIVNLRWVRDKSVAIIGAGNLGHPSLRTVCNMGFRAVSLIDDDTVDAENISPQDHDLVELGRPKVEALQNWTLRHCGLRINAIQERVQDWDHAVDLLNHHPDIVITAVDNMGARNAIYNNLINIMARRDPREMNKLPEVIIDMRMSAGEWTIYIIPLRAATLSSCLHLAQVKIEEEMMYEDSEAEQEACTARATNFTGCNAASYVGAFLTWFSNNSPMDTGTLVSFFTKNCTLTPFKYERSFDPKNWRYVTKPPEVLLKDQDFVDMRNREVMNEEKQADSLGNAMDMVTLMSRALPSEVDPEEGEVVLVKSGENFGVYYNTWMTAGDTLFLSKAGDASEKLVHVSQRNELLSFYRCHTFGLGRGVEHNPGSAFTSARDGIGDFIHLTDGSIYMIRTLLHSGRDDNSIVIFGVIDPEDDDFDDDEDEDALDYLLFGLEDCQGLISRDRVPPEYIRRAVRHSYIPYSCILPEGQTNGLTQEDYHINWGAIRAVEALQARIEGEAAEQVEEGEAREDGPSLSDYLDSALLQRTAGLYTRGYNGERIPFHTSNNTPGEDPHVGDIIIREEEESPRRSNHIPARVEEGRVSALQENNQVQSVDIGAAERSSFQAALNSIGGELRTLDLGGGMHSSFQEALLRAPDLEERTLAPIQGDFHVGVGVHRSLEEDIHTPTPENTVQGVSGYRCFEEEVGVIRPEDSGGRQDGNHLLEAVIINGEEFKVASSDRASVNIFRDGRQVRVPWRFVAEVKYTSLYSEAV